MSAAIMPINCPSDVVNSVIPCTEAEIVSKSAAESLDGSMSEVVG